MKMKLSLSIALSHQAELLILDEATSGLDPVVRDEILDILLDFLQDENHTVLISSHILSDLEKAADYIAFLHNGKLLFMEEKDLLVERYALCSLDDETIGHLDPEAIVGRRRHAFGQDLLVIRNLMPKSIKLTNASIEDIMVYIIKGWKVKALLYKDLVSSKSTYLLLLIMVGVIAGIAITQGAMIIIPFIFAYIPMILGQSPSDMKASRNFPSSCSQRRYHVQRM